MENIKCKTCGGSVTRSGNYYVCEWCRNKWEIDRGNDVHAVERANAWEALRNGDFDKAAEAFENIIVKDNKNHEAYWGRALSLGRILYVADTNEGKKVPTCNNITEDSFIEGRDVQTAISLAPSDIADNYKKQAEYIEKIRVEWLEKASKEPPYDVFISFKDSDRERGIERTQDSVDAQDLYNALVAEGYNVFFSRISLRDKISEQYEPYIYNAIKTAKVMIVFGERAEYFSSTWIKNEWSRFRARIEKGEKHKNSLVVVYKNMNPGDLPVILKSRQCMNAADMTFLSLLNKHIKRVIDESKQALHLEKIKVEGGQVSKRASKIENETIKIREIGAGAIAEVSISEKQQMQLARTYINMSQWEDARAIVDDVVFDNPNNPDAIFAGLLIKYKCQDAKALIKKGDSFTDEDYGAIERALNCETKENAAVLLDTLYSTDEVAGEEAYCKMLKTILPYQFEGREARIDEDFATAIKKDRFKVFNILLATLAENEVDRYINHNIAYAKKSANTANKKACIENVLKVEGGNVDALKLHFEVLWVDKGSDADLIKCLEEILKYSKNGDAQVTHILKYMECTDSIERHPALVKAALKYYTQPIEKLKPNLIAISARLLEKGCFSEAEYLLSLVLTFAPNDAEVYWLICLLKTRSHDERSLLKSNVSIKSVPEYTKYLTLIGDEQRKKCITLATKQAGEIEKRKKAEAELAARREAEAADKAAKAAARKRAELAAIEREKKKKRTRKIVFISALGVLAAALILIISLCIYRADCYKQAEEKLAAGNYSEAYELYKKSNGWKDSEEKLSAMREEASAVAKEMALEGRYQDAYNYLLTTDTYDDRKLREGYLAAVNGDYSTAAKKGVPHIIIPDGTVQIKNSAFSGCEELESVVIPDSVMSIGDEAFRGCRKLTSIVIPDSVTSIGDHAFRNCDKLTSIVIPDGVTNIGDYAFDSCYSLTSIVIPDSVTSIGDYAFRGCRKLTSIVIPDSVTSIGSSAFSSCDSLTSVTIGNGVTSIGGSAFYWCKSLTSIVIPDSVTSIGEDAFRYCTSLTSVTIGNGVTSIGSSAFYNCDALTSIVIPDSVTSIGEDAFYYCDGLTSVTIGNGVTSIGGSAFYYCNALTSVTIGNGVTSIGSSAFYKCTSLASITLPFVGAAKDGTSDTHFGYIFGASSYNKNDDYVPPSLKSVTINGGSSIKSNAFYQCNYLTSVTIGNGVTSIDSSAFPDCKNLTSVTIGNGVTSIGIDAFEGCSKLTSIVIPDSVTSIGGGAFSGCTSLASVTIPEGVTSIGESAFYGCTGLTGIVIPIGVSSIGKDAFAGCSKLAIYCEAKSRPNGWNTDWNSSLRTVTWGYNNVTTNSEYDYVVRGGKAYLTKYKGSSSDVVIPEKIDGYAVVYFGDIFREKTSIKSIVIPSGVTSIGDYAFYGCKSLASVTIPDSVTSIGNYAFYNCDALTSVTIGNGVTSIGRSAFYDCDNLTSIVIPDSVKSIGAYAFYSCYDLTSVTIGNGVTSIGDYAFNDCDALTNIVIPDSVTSIGDCAFESCSSLTSIVIPKSVKTVGYNAFKYCFKLTIYCEVLSAPSGWSWSWNYSSCPIVWGYNN